MTSFSAKADLFKAVYSERIADMDPITYDAQMNPASYAMEVRAHMEKTVVRKVSEQAIERVAERVGLSADDLVEFIGFLLMDPDIGHRFMAYRTAKRLKGE